VFENVDTGVWHGIDCLGAAKDLGGASHDLRAIDVEAVNLWACTALHARKLRGLELKASRKPARGQKRSAHAYTLKSQRDQERRWVEQAETAYARFVASCNATGLKARPGAAKEGRQ
jgi:hypothetical protein